METTADQIKNTLESRAYYELKHIALRGRPVFPASRSKVFTYAFEKGFTAGLKLKGKFIGPPVVIERRAYEGTACFQTKAPETETFVATGSRDAYAQAAALPKWIRAIRIELVEQPTIDTVKRATTNILPEVFAENGKQENPGVETELTHLPLVCWCDGRVLLKIDNEGFVSMDGVVVGRDRRLPDCFPKP